jgi:hypothetical protein
MPLDGGTGGRSVEWWSRGGTVVGVAKQCRRRAQGRRRKEAERQKWAVRDNSAQIQAGLFNQPVNDLKGPDCFHVFPEHSLVCFSANSRCSIYVRRQLHGECNIKVTFLNGKKHIGGSNF